jgi:hypothetical protein
MSEAPNHRIKLLDACKEAQAERDQLLDDKAELLKERDHLRADRAELLGTLKIAQNTLHWQWLQDAIAHYEAKDADRIR